jgi:hypothetical protein
MIIRDDAATLELKPGESIAGDEAASDVHCAAEISTPLFSGRNPSVWITKRAWATFITTLRALEIERTGEAQLESMSPADLAIHVHVYDRAGHIKITGHVGSDVIWRDGVDVSRLPFRIELDPTKLAAMIAGLEQVAARSR